MAAKSTSTCRRRRIDAASTLRFSRLGNAKRWRCASAGRSRARNHRPCFDAFLRGARFVIRIIEHLVSGVALAFAAVSARFAPSWFEIPYVDRPPDMPLPFLSIVVPARDEERSIDSCVRSLAMQRHVETEIVVVDDRSTDATPALLDALAARYPHVRVVRGEPLPDGWVGKPWALHQGAAVARGTWLLFVDADSTHEPAGVSSALRFALAARTDALSIVTRQVLGSLGERATLPFVLGMIFFASGTLAEINDPMRPERALANGQYVLVTREAYDALGGYVALRDEIVEDVEFARRIKVDGRFRYVLGGGTRLANVRMYRSFTEVWAGFAKNLYVGARGNVAGLGAGVALALLLAAPPFLACSAIARRRPYAALECVAATAAILTTTARGIAMVGMPPATALLQPLGMVLFAAMMSNSTWCVLSGRGVAWRGRRYTGRRATQPEVTRTS